MNDAIFASNFAKTGASGTASIIETQSLPVRIHHLEYYCRFLTDGDFFTIDVNPAPTGWSGTEIASYVSLAAGLGSVITLSTDANLILPPGSRVTYNCLISDATCGFRGRIWWETLDDYEPVVALETTQPLSTLRSPFSFIPGGVMI